MVTFQFQFYFYSGLTRVCSLCLSMGLFNNDKTVETSDSQNQMNQQKEDATC